MAVRQYANAPATTLTNACTSLSTSINVASVAGLPISYPYVLIIDRGLATEEAVEVTAAAGTNLTVTRGIDSTTAFAHASGAVVVHGITARDIREANAHVNATGSVHGVSGTLVGTTDTQTLSNKTLASPVLTGNPTAPTVASTDSDTTVATTAFVQAAIADAVAAAKLAMHPVGSIRVQTVNTNPGTFLGGTWVPWGSGRVPVGVDGTQPEFDGVEETGGEKTHVMSTSEMPAHDHGVSQTPHSHALSPSVANVGGGTQGLTNTNVTIGVGVSDFTAAEVANITINSNGSSLPFNILQPYITCYMFKRTA